MHYLHLNFAWICTDHDILLRVLGLGEESNLKQFAFFWGSEATQSKYFAVEDRNDLEFSYVCGVKILVSVQPAWPAFKRNSLLL